MIFTMNRLDVGHVYMLHLVLEWVVEVLINLGFFYLCTIRMQLTNGEKKY